MYTDFIDIVGTSEEVRAKIDSSVLSAHVREDTFIRNFGQTSYNVTRVYVVSSEDYVTLARKFSDVFILFRLSESSFVL